MQGHLRQRGKNGVWYAVFRVNGKLKWHRLKATGKREAEKELTKLMAGVHDGSYVESARLTVREYLENKWVPLVVEKEWAPSTLAKFAGYLAKYVFPTIGEVQLQRLNGLHLQEMYSDMMAGKFGKRLASQSVRVLHVQLHKAFRQAVTWGLITKNPAEGATVKRGKAKKKRILTGQETAQLLEHFRGTDMYIPTLIMVCTGMRRGEVLGIRWSDVDLDKRRLLVEQALSRVNGENHLREPKTDGSERVITMPPMMVDALRQHRQTQKVRSLGNDLICTREDGSPMIPTTFSDRFAKHAAAAGFDNVTPHCMRHGYATLLAEEGVRDTVISELLGHRGTHMLKQVYDHVRDAAREEAAQTFETALRRKKGAR